MFKRISFALVVLVAIVVGVRAVQHLGPKGRVTRNAFPGTGTVTQVVPHLPSSLPPVGSTTDQIRHPRFKVEMQSITAVDEVGWDWTGFDEIFAVYDTQQHRIVTSAYLMDTGDVVQFPLPGVETEQGALRGLLNESCIWPVLDSEGPGWDCIAEGGAAPVVFAVSLWEEDDQVAFGGLGFCVGGGPNVYPASENIPCIDYHDYLFSSQIYSYTEADLLQELPAPLDHMIIDYGLVRLTPAYEPNSGFEYHIKVRITRVADFIEERPRDVDPTPE